MVHQMTHAVTIIFLNYWTFNYPIKALQIPNLNISLSTYNQLPQIPFNSIFLFCSSSSQQWRTKSLSWISDFFGWRESSTSPKKRTFTRPNGAQFWLKWTQLRNKSRCWSTTESPYVSPSSLFSTLMKFGATLPSDPSQMAHARFWSDYVDKKVC